MTQREFYNAIVAMGENVSDEIREYAAGAIEKLDTRNSARKAKPSKAAVENAPIKAAIYDYLNEHADATAGDIGKALEISTQKASALCVQLREEGKIVATDHKNKPKTYAVADAE